VFADHVDQSKWVSFTATLHQPTLFRLVRECTGNVPGEGGLIGQPENVSLLWGYGLSVDRPGDFVKKPMSPCSGREIMTEVLGHLRIAAVAASILDTCILHSLHDAPHDDPIHALRDRRPARRAPHGTHNLAALIQRIAAIQK
jgi:myosin-crossreactive antigen